VAGGLAAVALSACGSSSGQATSTSVTTATAPASTTTPTTVAPTPTSTVASTTTVALPADLQPSDADAAAALIAAWKSGNRTAAAQVATAAAVNTLFASPYAGQTVISRGCSVSFPPLICSYGEEGGGSTSGSLYELSTLQAAAGWYVSSVTVET
jgi:hypothetical protein